MKKFLEKFEPADFVAVICIIGGLILIGCKIDTIVGGLISLIAGYYFGHKRKEENDKITYEKIKEQ